MRIPNFIKKGDTIAVTAPSDGLKEVTDHIRLDNAKNNLMERGYKVIETRNVRNSVKGRSTAADIRAKEFTELMENEDISYIVSACGGDFLMEILEFINFERIKKNPKWIQGYSDNTGLLFSITTICDIPTVYSGNIGDYGMENLHKAVENNLDILEGKLVTQKNFEFYEAAFTKKETGLESYNLTESVKYRLIGGEEAKFSGMLLGGCLDVLINLCGTKYDKVRDFLKRNSKNGIIWYLESFALSSARLETALWQLKEAGWFEGVSGFLFGRPCFFNEEYETSFEEAVKNALSDFNVPIITGCDIGHRPPRLTVINGFEAEISFKSDEFLLVYVN